MRYDQAYGEPQPRRPIVQPFLRSLSWLLRWWVGTNAEKRLWVLFKSIDRDQDTRLSRTELKEAFQRSEISVGESRLDELFTRVDSKGDGEIIFVNEAKYAKRSYLILDWLIMGLSPLHAGKGPRPTRHPVLLLSWGEGKR